ncbi:MAG: methylamine---corrinoid protein Co-methyltransferase [Deltaproteobacteria bacterium]|nr:methylamine---corrinoid protein Co-methyltransferase [Deltaproteobacteria bacterium]
MIPIMDFQDRCSRGPVMQADDFDLELAFKVRELVAEYDIKYDPGNLVVSDRTADAIFHAAVDLLADIGLYQMNTGRVVKYTKEELEQIAKESRENPACVTLGKSPDKMTLRHRKGTDTWAPTNYAGPAGVAAKEWFIPYVQSVAQEPSVAGIGICPGLARLDNVDPKAGTLTEVYVALWEQEALREALKRAGRLHLNLGLLGTASTPSGTMAVMEGGFRDAYNTQIGIHIMPEQKLSWNPLLLAQYCEIRGIEPWQSSMSCIGGLCRDGAEVAVTMVANGLGQMSYAHGATMSYFPSHLDGTWATRDSHWAFSGAARASERHLGLAVGSSISGIDRVWRTPVSLWQSAAVVAVYVASGMSYSWISGHTGLEARLIDQMMKACTGLSAERANDLAQKIMRKVDELLPTIEKQVAFPDAYDLDTVRPKPAYEAGMLRVMDELARLGMPLN